MAVQEQEVWHDGCGCHPLAGPPVGRGGRPHTDRQVSVLHRGLNQGVLCNMAVLWVIVSFNPFLPPPQSGALLACGIVNCGVRNECDPALVLLYDDVVHHSNIIIGCVRGRGHHWVC